MARTCIDWEPDDVPSDASRPRIIHVTKVPPSNSGIARHAGPFDRSLARVGSLTTVGLRLDAHESQRIGTTIRLARRVLRHLRDDAPDLVIYDLSGRALAEFYSACIAALVPKHRRPVLWLVAHDSPELVGPPMLFSFFDRKGWRRVGMALSRWIGRPLERWLVSRVGAILSFSELGAGALRERFDHLVVRAVPLPTELLSASSKEPIVYCPAGVSAADLAPTLEAFGAGGVPQYFRLRVGNLSGPDRELVVGRAEYLAMNDRVEFTGFLDQKRLDESFTTASIVVRHRSATGRPQGWGAASGPLVSALAAGCAVVSTDPRGSARCVAVAGRDLSATPEKLSDEIAATANDPRTVQELGARATEHIRSTHVPEAVARYLRAVWYDTRPGGTSPPLRRTRSAPKTSST